MRKAAEKRPTIGVLAGIQVYYGTILGNFIGPLLHGVCSAAENRRCNLLLACGMGIASAQARPAWPLPSPDVDFLPVGPWNVDGLIAVSPLFSEPRSEYIRGLMAGGFPVVFAATGEPGPTVAIDNVGAIRQGIQHLMAHGHRNIAFIAGSPGDSTGDSGIRLKAFREVVQEYGLAAEPELIHYGHHGIAGGQQAMQQILNSGLPFTAVLASNDESAIGAMTVLKARGLRVPQDVAIIGIDDTFEAITQVPPLTTFHSSPFRMGYRALELLLDHIEDPKKDLDSLTIPMQLVIRESCGCQPGAGQPVIVGDSRESASHNDERVIASYLAKKTADAALAGTQRLSPGEVRSRCENLVDAFMKSLHAEDPAGFRLALEETLTRVEILEDDMHVWEAVLSALEDGLPLIRRVAYAAPIDERANAMVKDARAMIARFMQRQYRRWMIHQTWIADQVGQLNSRLLTALDEAQIYEILASYLPQVGIQHMGVGFFEPEGDDPVAWCWLRKVSEEGLEHRFRSRQFPPGGLYDEPYRLVLLPIAGWDEMFGFVAFDAANLEICAHIAWQLVTFLRVVRSYREATRGRQLAEEANRLKSRFLSTVSHELRTPLNLILGLSDMLVQGEDGSETETRRDLKRIRASAQHLDGLIRDVLDLARNEVGELQLVCEPLNLGDVLEVVAAVGEQLVHDKGLEWQVAIPGDLPKVWGDRTRLRQVVLNLISNAVKFTARGRVSMRVNADDETVTIEISDTGLGIPAEEQGVIFDEFRQSNRTAGRGYGGLGLGLAICKRLVELHGGSIGVRSSGEEGAGSTFYFTLPALQGEAGAPETRRHDQTVLLLAERSGNWEDLRGYLAQRGFEVEMVWVDTADPFSPRWLKSRPGAVVLEQGTATRQGWEVMKVLRENPLTREVPVLFYSLDGERDRGSILELNYLTKPLSRTELVQALEQRGIRRNPSRGQATILVVDDEPGTLELHARMVATWSPQCHILKARNGRQALELIQEAHPDLVLLDLMMPELDGFGVLEAMQSDARSRDIPVIVLTGQTLTLDDMTRLNRGVTSVLEKGLFTANETLSHIEGALARSGTLGSEAQRVVRKAIAYVHEHYMEAISLEDSARHVGMSKEYLARCFRQEMGITLVTYLNRYRVKQAKKLLEEGNGILTKVAMETGFSSSTYFSRVFRQEVGMSPGEYKRSMKGS